MINYEKKYLKYKQKYLRLKLDSIKGGYLPNGQIIQVPKKTKLEELSEKVQETSSEAVEQVKKVVNDTGNYIKETGKSIYDKAINMAENVIGTKSTEEKDSKTLSTTEIEELN